MIKLSKMKTCPVCDHSIVGRSDKKYCSDQCRNSFNNERKSASKEFTIIYSILKKNREILEEMVEQRRKKTKKEKLLQQGFNFYYFTSIDTAKRGSQYFCFEYGYYPLENNYYALVKRQ